MSFPDIVWNSPEWKDALKRIFNYNAACYRLDHYERIVPGSGARIWKQILLEIEHQKSLKSKK